MSRHCRSPGIKSQSNRSAVRVGLARMIDNSVGLTSILDRGQFVSQFSQRVLCDGAECMMCNRCELLLTYFLPFTTHFCVSIFYLIFYTEPCSSLDRRTRAHLSGNTVLWLSAGHNSTDVQGQHNNDRRILDVRPFGRQSCAWLEELPAGGAWWCQSAVRCYLSTDCRHSSRSAAQRDGRQHGPVRRTRRRLCRQLSSVSQRRLLISLIAVNTSVRQSCLSVLYTSPTTAVNGEYIGLFKY